jgi:Secretion system C-terminal sorting domain
VATFTNEALTLKVRAKEGDNQTASHHNGIQFTCSPNPASDQITISYSLEQDATLSVEIVDALQRVVLRPVGDETREAGSYMLSVPTRTLPSGAYTVRLTTKNTEGIPTRQIQSLILNH